MHPIQSHYNYIRIVITQTFGSNITYINRLLLFDQFYIHPQQVNEEYSQTSLLSIDPDEFAQTIPQRPTPPSNNNHGLKLMLKSQLSCLEKEINQIKTHADKKFEAIAHYESQQLQQIKDELNSWKPEINQLHQKIQRIQSSISNLTRNVQKTQHLSQSRPLTIPDLNTQSHHSQKDISYMLDELQHKLSLKATKLRQLDELLQYRNHQPSESNSESEYIRLGQDPFFY